MLAGGINISAGVDPDVKVAARGGGGNDLYFNGFAACDDLRGVVFGPDVSEITVFDGGMKYETQSPGPFADLHTAFVCFPLPADVDEVGGNTMLRETFRRAVKGGSRKKKNKKVQRGVDKKIFLW